MQRNLSDLASLNHTSQARINIPQPSFRWKTRVFLPFGIVIALASFFLIAGYEALLPAIPVQMAPVLPKQVERVTPGSAVVQAAGWIEANPYQIHISALADGIVEEVFVLEGELVKKGQLIARLIKEDAEIELQRAKAILLEKEASLELAQADLTAAQANWENPIAQEHLVEVRKAEIKETQQMVKQASAQILVEKALLTKAKSDYDRTKPLLKEDATSESDVINTYALFLAQQAKLEAAQNNRSMIQERIPRLTANLKAAKEHLRLRIEEHQKLAEAKANIKLTQAALEEAKVTVREKELQLKRMEIYSPIEGVVMRRHIAPGSKIIKGMDNEHSSHVISLYNPKKLQVRVDVPLVDVALVGLGQQTEIVVEVLPDKIFMGKVTRIIHEADIQKNTLEVKVEIIDPRPEIRPEMLTRVRFLATQQKETQETETRESLFVPKSAIQTESGENWIWLITKYDGTFGTAERKIVKPQKNKVQDWVEIPEGLKMGDLVVVNPPQNLKPNSRIRVTGEFSPTED